MSTVINVKTDAPIMMCRDSETAKGAMLVMYATKEDAVQDVKRVATFLFPCAADAEMWLRLNHTMMQTITAQMTRSEYRNTRQ